MARCCQLGTSPRACGWEAYLPPSHNRRSGARHQPLPYWQFLGRTPLHSLTYFGALLARFSLPCIPLISVHHFRQTRLISTQLPWFPHYSPSSQIKVNLLPTRSQLVRKNSMPKRRMRNVARQSLPCRCPYTTVGTSAATSCRTKSLSS